jgi:hypothetical protein
MVKEYITDRRRMLTVAYKGDGTHRGRRKRTLCAIPDIRRILSD